MSAIVSVADIESKAGNGARLLIWRKPKAYQPVKPGRNDPCPCGSGKKYKRCCGEQMPQPPPSSSAIPVDLGELATLMNQGRYTEVEPRARRLIDAHPNLGFAWKIYGAALALQAKDGLHALRKASELLPADAETHFYLGNAWHDRGDLAAAIDSHRRAVDLKPDLSEAHDALGVALRDAGRLEESAASHRRALAVRPDYADAHGNLGNALKDLGRVAEAVDSYRRLCELMPESADAHNHLGNALLSLGRFAEAVACYRRVTALRPLSAVAFANLGNALRGLGRPQEAAESCRCALEIEPEFADAHRYLGNAWFDLGQFDRAAASYERALAINPDYAEVHAALGVVLRQTGRGEEAEASCRRALAVNPDLPETLALLGDIQASQGQFAVAEESFKRALSIDPDLPEGWAGIARYRKMGDADSPWLAAAQRLVDKSLPIQHEINLRYAIGKYFDDVKDFDQAFANYRLANELTRRYGIQHDRQRLTRRVDRLIASYDGVWLETTSAEANPSERPVFIVGMPRAGTTLGEQILASHPAVHGVGELRFWHSASAEYEKSIEAGQMNSGVIASLGERYLRQLAELPRDALRSSDALRVVDKMPANTMNLGLIHAALPRARIIHLRRHPIDTCLSIYFQAFSTTHSYANDLEDLAHYYAQYFRVMEHWRSTLPENAILDIPYEGLVEDPEAWSRQMIEFIGLPWDPRCLDFYQTKRTVLTASSWQVRQKITKSSAGRWHHYEKFVGPLRRLLELHPHG
jgi:tetratricopeptide (TPR) repeat protein